MFGIGLSLDNLLTIRALIMKEKENMEMMMKQIGVNPKEDKYYQRLVDAEEKVDGIRKFEQDKRETLNKGV